MGNFAVEKAAQQFDADENRVEVYNRHTYNPLKKSYVYFRPALVYQQLLHDHVADAGLEFALDMSDHNCNSKNDTFFTTNKARFPTPAGVPEVVEGTETFQTILKKQFSCCKNGEEREDAERVKAKLRTAATWGETEKVRKLIMTCYVSERIASELLCELVQTENTDIVQTLLEAKARADLPFQHLRSKTSLHLACEAGNEEIAMKLINSISQREGVYRKTDEGETAFDLARLNDHVNMARRLQKIVEP